MCRQLKIKCELIFTPCVHTFATEHTRYTPKTLSHTSEADHESLNVFGLHHVCTQQVFEVKERITSDTCPSFRL